MSVKNNDNLLHMITAASIDKYLSLNGWKRDYNFKNDNLMVFSFFNTNERIAIPANEKYSDFYISLEKVIETISLFQKKPVVQIIKEISSVFFDRMEFRIVSSSTSDGRLPLEFAYSCIEGLKDLILYSACAELSTQPVCAKATNSAKDALSDFKLAQTELGSFIINVDIKVIDEGNEQMYFEPCYTQKPLGHKVVERIYNSINQIDSIVQKQNTLTDIVSDGYQKGVTANICDAFLKMKPIESDAQIDTTIRYASALTHDKNNARRIVVNNDHFHYFNEISKIYKDKKEIQDVILSGYIKTLNKKDDNKIVKKNIKLITLFEGKIKNILINLSDEDYVIACDAHRDEKEVEISGVLDMSKKTWELTKVNYFKVL